MSAANYNVVTIVFRENQGSNTPYLARTVASDGGLGSTTAGELGAYGGGVLVWAYGKHVDPAHELTFDMPCGLGSPARIELDPGNRKGGAIYVLTIPKGLTSCDEQGYKAYINAGGSRTLIAPDPSEGAREAGNTGEIKMPP